MDSERLDKIEARLNKLENSTSSTSSMFSSFLPGSKTENAPSTSTSIFGSILGNNKTEPAPSSMFSMPDTKPQSGGRKSKRKLKRTRSRRQKY